VGQQGSAASLMFSWLNACQTQFEPSEDALVVNCQVFNRKMGSGGETGLVENLGSGYLLANDGREFMESLRFWSSNSDLGSLNPLLPKKVKLI